MTKRKEIRYVTLPDPEEIKELEKKFVGRRITLTVMPGDPQPVLPGTQGECVGIDALGQLLMKWDTGSTLNLIPGVDLFNLNEKEE